MGRETRSSKRSERKSPRKSRMDFKEKAKRSPKRKRPLSKEGKEAQKQQHVESAGLCRLLCTVPLQDSLVLASLLRIRKGLVSVIQKEALSVLKEAHGHHAKMAGLARASSFRN